MNISEMQNNPYLWAVGPVAAKVPSGQIIADRYHAIAPQIWLDTKPEEPTDVPAQFPSPSIPYLRLFPHRLHIPEIYSFCWLNSEQKSDQIILLENVPLDSNGNLLPSLLEAWPTATPVRQVYWLWQLIQLWTPLAELGVATSLLNTDNIRVQGWRVRLLQLYADPIANNDKSTSVVTANSAEANTENNIDTQTQPSMPSMPTMRLQELGYSWFNWMSKTQTEVGPQLKEICRLMRRSEATITEISSQLNQLLIEQAAEIPLRLQAFGGTDTGPSRRHNEDTCYPILSDLQNRRIPPNDKLIPYLSIVCDGVGGHEGGEVASQTTVSSLKTLVQSLLIEISQDKEIMSPDVVAKQLEEIIRVINNTIAAQNDTQQREARQRMATTLIMALQLPQKLGTYGNSHELYLATVGDSRAYWMTKDYCCQLNIDDDIAVREVRMGRNIYRAALQLPEAGALTQALGTRDAEYLRPNIQRFIIEEDGLLLLCSDGLSDNNLVEQYWRECGPAVVNNEISLEAATEFFIKLANNKNGHDNTSVVLTYYRISTEPLVLFEPTPVANKEITLPEMQLTDASKALLYGEAAENQSPEESVVVPTRGRRRENNLWVNVVTVLVVLFGVGVVGLTAWRLLDTPGFDRQMQNIFKS